MKRPKRNNRKRDGHLKIAIWFESSLVMTR